MKRAKEEHKKKQPKLIVFHVYLAQETINLRFDKDSNRIQREKFSVYLERKYLS